MSPPLSIPLLNCSFHKGEPALKIPKLIVDSLAKPFQFALISKFSHGRPSMERSRQIFTKLGLKGSFFLGHLNPKHMIICLQKEDDFNRIWLREVWFLDGFPMRTIRWSSEFCPDVESSITLVLISFPSLPIFLFNKKILFSTGSAIGKPLNLDSATDLSCPSVAWVCVELDLLKRLPHRVWVKCESMARF